MKAIKTVANSGRAILFSEFPYGKHGMWTRRRHSHACPQCVGSRIYNFLLKKIPLILDKFLKILVVVIYFENIEYALKKIKYTYNIYINTHTNILINIYISISVSMFFKIKDPRFIKICRQFHSQK